jgi:hypothetical protein
MLRLLHSVVCRLDWGGGFSLLSPTGSSASRLSNFWDEGWSGWGVWDWGDTDGRVSSVAKKGEEHIHFSASDLAACPVGLEGLQLVGLDAFLYPMSAKHDLALFPSVLPP